jgi:hypothetical protein
VYLGICFVGLSEETYKIAWTGWCI